MMVNVQTIAQPSQKMLATSGADTSFPSRIPTNIQPALALPIGIGGSVTQNLARIMPYGAGADNATFSFRIIGWNVTTAGLWVPVVLFEGTATLSAALGLAGFVPSATDRFADTLTVATPYQSKNSIEAISPVGDVIAHVVVDMKGSQMIELTISTGSSATNGNALVVMY